MNIFQSKLSKLSGDSLAKYRRSLTALEAFLISHGMTKFDLSPKVVEDWAYELIRQDKRRITIVRNLNVLSSVLKGVEETNLIEAAKRARELARRFESTAIVIPVLMQERVFNACLAIVQLWFKEGNKNDVSQDVMLVSLLNGCLPVNKIIQLRKASISSFYGLTRTILERNQSPNRDFAFDLRQSYRTPRQIARTISEKLAMKFGKYIGSEDFDLDELIRSLWVAMAIRCGATATDALRCVGVSAKYVTPDFLSVKSVDERSKDRWSHAIEILLEQVSPHWYAMQMRRGVSFDELQKEIVANICPVPTLFYPCEMIARNIHNRRVLAEQPFITQTVFFKLCPDDVLPMFAKIGDKAWCYRMSNSPSAPYAVIPKHEMQRFQSAISQFTPDMEIHPIGQIPIKPEDKVVLLMADFYNQEAKVAKVISADEGTTVYRVVFRDKSGFEWSVNADTRQLKRAN